MNNAALNGVESAEADVAALEGVRAPLSAEDELRAQVYRLLAGSLAGAPGAERLEAARGLAGDDSDFGRAIGAFASAARQATPEALTQAYHDLFIGLGRGELLPYGSYYLTGFLNEKPLARLRDAMAELGIERDPEVKEPEDHIAALCDMMAGLILGEYGAVGGSDTQKHFFEAHLAPWGNYFFRDLEATNSAPFYAALGTVGGLFLEIEKNAFSMT